MQYQLTSKSGVYYITYENGVNIRATRIHEDHDGVHADLTFTTQKSPKSYLLQTRMNLLSSRTRQQMAKMLNERYPIGEIEWLSIVESACIAIVNALRCPTPAVLLGSDSAPPLSWVLRPVVPAGEATVIFGPGGTGKSYTALLFGILVATGYTLPGLPVSELKGPVLYVDWESSQAELQRRMTLICQALNIKPEEVPLYYLQGNGPFPGNEHIGTVVTEINPVLVILDSLGLAASGPLNEPHTAVTFYRAVRQLGTNTLVIAHTPKYMDDHASTIFGSAYFAYLARSIWELTSEREPSRLTVTLYHRKFNLGRLQPPIALEFTFGQNLVINAVEPQADFIPVTMAERILKILEASPFPLRITEIAEALDIPINTVSKELVRLAEKGKVERLSRGRYRIKSPEGQNKSEAEAPTEEGEDEPDDKPDDDDVTQDEIPF